MAAIPQPSKKTLTMMFRLKINIVSLLPLLLVAACSSDTQVADPEVQLASEFSVKYKVNSEAADTRAENTLDGDFKVTSWYYDQTDTDPLYMGGAEILFVGFDINSDGKNFMGEHVSKDETGVWRTEVTHWWPREWLTVDFYAQYPVSVPDIELTQNADGAGDYVYKGVPYSSYPGEDVTDMLYAFKSTNRRVVLATNGTVTLDFRHALSQLLFRGVVSEENPDWVVTVKDLSIHHVYASGKFDIGREEFNASSMANPRDYDLTMNGSAPIVVTGTEESIALTDPSKPQVMLGQKLKPWNIEAGETIATTKGCYLELDLYIYRMRGEERDELLGYMDGDNIVYKKAYVPFAPEWHSGKIHTYTLHFGGGYDETGIPNIVETEITVSVTDWEAGTTDDGGAKYW